MSESVEPSLHLADVVSIFDGPTMISDIETNLTILIWPKLHCLELVCKVFGIVEDTVYLYLNHRKTMTMLPRDLIQDTTLSKKELKKRALIEFIMPRLGLVEREDDPNMWKLLLYTGNPRKVFTSSEESCGKSPVRVTEPILLDILMIPKPDALEDSLRIVPPLLHLNSRHDAALEEALASARDPLESARTASSHEGGSREELSISSYRNANNPGNGKNPLLERAWLNSTAQRMHNEDDAITAAAMAAAAAVPSTSSTASSFSLMNPGSVKPSFSVALAPESGNGSPSRSASFLPKINTTESSSRRLIGSISSPSHSLHHGGGGSGSFMYPEHVPGASAKNAAATPGGGRHIYDFLINSPSIDDTNNSKNINGVHLPAISPQQDLNNMTEDDIKRAVRSIADSINASFSVPTASFSTDGSPTHDTASKSPDAAKLGSDSRKSRLVRRSMDHTGLGHGGQAAGGHGLGHNSNNSHHSSGGGENSKRMLRRSFNGEVPVPSIQRVAGNNGSEKTMVAQSSFSSSLPTQQQQQH